jgi:hypothetical protein
MRDYHFYNQSEQTDTVPSTIAVPEINMPSTIQINTQLTIPQRRIELIQPDSAKEAARSRIYRPAPPPPPPKLSSEDSLALNLIDADSLYTNWNFSTEVSPSLQPSEFMVIGDSLLISESQPESDSTAVTTPTIFTEPSGRETHTSVQKETATDPPFEKPILKQDWFVAILMGMVCC